MLQEFGGHKPKVHERAFVHEGAWVIGEVELAEGVTVWPGVVLRGDMGPIVIGKNSNIQDGAICHDTTDISQTMVGEGVTIGHRAILHGCIVEDDCLIGMGAIVLDNAVIGKGSLIAAGAVVGPGKKIPPGSVVMGVPGRVVKQADERTRKQIEFSKLSYLGKLDAWLAR